MPIFDVTIVPHTRKITSQIKAANSGEARSKARIQAAELADITVTKAHTDAEKRALRHMNKKVGLGAVYTQDAVIKLLTDYESKTRKTLLNRMKKRYEELFTSYNGGRHPDRVLLGYRISLRALDKAISDDDEETSKN